METRAGAFDARGRLWLAGAGSAPLRWDGASWHSISEGLPPAPSPSTALGTTGNEVWLVHGGRLYRHEADRWEEVDRGRFPFAPTALWVTPEAVWLAGPEVRKNDGTGWESLSVIGHGPFHALWGGDGEVFAAGAEGAVYRWRRGEWSHLPTPTDRTLRSIWGHSSSDVWFGGDGGTLLRFQQDAFRAYDLGIGASILSIVGRAEDDVLALGFDATARQTALYHFDGRFWRKLALPGGVEPQTLWPSDEGVWLGGRGGGLALWTGECFRIRAGDARRVSDLWEGRWAVGERGLILRAGEDGLKPVDAGVGADLNAVFGLGDEVWIAGDEGVLLRGDENGFRRVHGAGTRNHLAMHGSGDHLWIGSDDGSIFRADGRSLTQTPTPFPSPIDSILSFGDEAWAGTRSGELLRWNGSKWGYERSTFGSPTLFGTGPDDLWYLGRQGEVALLERWDGREWTIVPQGASTTVHALASRGEELWVGHAPNVLHHWDGSRWTARHLPFRPRALSHDGEDLWILAERHLLRWRDSKVVALHASPVPMTALFADGERVWIGTVEGSIGELREDGLVFGEPLAEGAIRDLRGSEGAIWAVGDRGTLLRFDEGGWRAEAPPADADFRSVAVSGERMWLASSEGVLHRDEGGWRWLEDLPSDVSLVRTDGGLVYLAEAEGGVHALDPEGSGILYTLHASVVARALVPGPGGDLWIGGEPTEDGAHLLRFDGRALERIDLGVTLAADTAAAFAPGEAIVARGGELFLVAPSGERWLIGITEGPVGSFSRQRDGFVPMATGRLGGILRLHLLEFAP